MIMASSSSARPQRLLRISKACDFCHKRRIKCQDSPGDVVSRCRNCAEFDIPCTYARPSRRGRGSPQPSRPSSSSASAATGPGSLSQYGLGSGDPATKAVIRHPPFPSSHTTSHLPPHHPHSSTAIVSPTTGRVTFGEHTTRAEDGGHIGNERLSATWQAFAHTSTPILKRLAAVYHETVFPINRAFFCSVMAASALASARARDGALSSPTGGTSGNGKLAASSAVSANPSGVGAAAIDMPPEMFYAAAEEALPKDILQCRDFDYLRALALLSIASIQDAKIAVMQKYIGHYFTLLAINQWHDEANWPPGLHATEIEERRRLYWSTYTLDVFTSIIWDGCIHFQESHAKVEYPTGLTELEQERLEHRKQRQQQQQQRRQRQGGRPSSSSSEDEPMPNAPGSLSPSWMIGWNFTTDLYRILEHNLNKLRSRSSKFNLLGETTTPGSFRVSSQDRVNELYSSLPAVFKQIEPATGDPARDIFGFQAANIQATMALLEMVHLSLEIEVDIERKCSVVHNVLQTFHKVPRAYMRAISAPLIYHIGGIGVILGTVMEGPLSENSYRLVRDLLLSMALLLESLETFLHRSAGTGQRLRTLVSRLEGYYLSMRSQTQEGGSDGAKNRQNSIISNTSSSSNNSGLSTPRPTNDTAMPTKPENSPPTPRTFEQPQAHGGNTGNYRPAGGHVGPLPDANGSAKMGSIENSGGSLASFSSQQQQQQQHHHHHPHSHQHVYHHQQQQQLPPHQPHHSSAQHLQEQPGHQAFASSSNPQGPLPPAVAGSLYDPQSQLPPHVAHPRHADGASNGGPLPTHIPPPPGSVPITGPGAPGVPGGPASWVTSATGPGLTTDVNMQFHLPDELLQDWTWPFAVSNNYLSF
ncbi:zinc c6 transcription factor [Ophiostoma piceae UAMH 11346]|uniref:Zinc c6 transcription factor n=1 Tax=Ophiostoma piceae (strain UAMH 11346) TaxID=1262450 RepID=S3CNM1_OPHP1|nr:zinc c6 transcription factor [Ophiostoma piceae UAMH 11346]